MGWGKIERKCGGSGGGEGGREGKSNIETIACGKYCGKKDDRMRRYLKLENRRFYIEIRS